MRSIPFDPDTLKGADRAWWDNWVVRAQKATDKIVATWEAKGKVTTGDFNEAIWGDLKAWLYSNVYRENCAYCEKYLDSRSYFDAEHFRPKGKVTEQGTASPVNTTRADGTEIAHPGYFWLAYRWENLLPSCQACNSGHGKQNQFPTEKGHIFELVLTPPQAKKLKQPPIETKVEDGKTVYLLGPFDLDVREDRKLLHPVFDTPENHLMFDAFGQISARKIEVGSELIESPKGSASIEVYNLDTDKISRERQKQIDDYYLKYLNFLIAENMKNSPNPTQSAFDEVVEVMENATEQGFKSATQMGLHAKLHVVSDKMKNVL